MYTCPDCGSEMKFDPSRQKLYCEFCGKTLDPQKNEPSSARNAGEHTEDSAHADPSPDTAAKEIRPTYKAHVFVCPSCGAQLLSTDETVATFCSYCGSSILIQSRLAEEFCPDYVIPFRITKEACENAYKKTLRRALFVPDEMKQDTQIERFRGIYMPYWIYSFEQDSNYRVRGSKSRRRGDYIYTKHYRLDSHLTASCRGLSYDASSSFADNLSAAIAPFDIRESTGFTPEYLSGFYADRGDVSASIYHSQAEDMAGRYVAGQANKNRTYRKYNASLDTMASAFRPKRTEAKLGMFPVWFLGCRSHDGKRISYAVINGQTGKVAADLPIDMKKYLLGSLILAIPLFILLNIFLTLTPTKALIISIVLALSSLLLSNRQLNRIYTRDLQLDDMGLQSVTGRRSLSKRPRTTARDRSGNIFLRILSFMAVVWISMAVMGILLFRGPFRSGISTLIIMFLWVILTSAAAKSILIKPTGVSRKASVVSAPMKEKIGVLYKPLLSVGIALAILIWSPVSDLFYYAGAAASLGCVIWSFFDIIKEHNLLTTRQLPQLNKRGGDENA